MVNMNKIELTSTEEVKNLSRLELYKQEKEMVLSFVSPILFALLMGLKNEVVQSLNGYDKIRLRELARNYRNGDGDCGICFEYSIHSAIRKKSPLIIQRINKALEMCGIHGENTTSILLGFEKNRVLQINDELLSNLTEKSTLITDATGSRINLFEHIYRISESFRSSNTRNRLPNMIKGLWKADLLIGNKDNDLWAATSVKINPIALKSEKGIAIGITPSRWNRPLPIKIKQSMVICPLLYDNGFMQFFYAAWRTVKLFLISDALVPHERLLYSKVQLQIAEYLEHRRETPVMELVDDIFTKLTHKTILLPENKSIITTDAFDTTHIENTNCSIIVPELFIVDNAL